jgi:hypothetical protein
MRKTLALLALPLLAVCSPSDEPREEQLPDTNVEAPEAPSEESLSAWTIDVGSGDAAGFQLLVEGSDLVINTTTEGRAWRPVDLVMGGDFEVNAVFEPRDSDTAAGDQYGIMVGGKNLPDADRAYTLFLARPTGEHRIERHEAGAVHTLIDWKSGPNPAVPPSSPVPPGPNQQLAVRVAGENVEFLIGGTLVATLARTEAQPHGIAGVHVGPNTNVEVSGWSVRGAQVGQPTDSNTSEPTTAPRRP